MRAVDTNVVVRFLTNDDAVQSPQTKSVFDTEQVWIAKTVLLEASWVLQSAYRYKMEDIRSGFRWLMAIDSVHVEDAAVVDEALRLLEEGLDFADALHLVSRPSDSVFLSFEEALVRRAQRAGVTEVRLLGKRRIN